MSDEDIVPKGRAWSKHEGEIEIEYTPTAVNNVRKTLMKMRTEQPNNDVILTRTIAYLADYMDSLEETEA